MDRLEKNLTALGKRSPDLKEILRKSEKSERVEPEVSKTGMPTLRVKGVLLHSAYDPESEAVKTVSLFDHTESDSILILGFGFGYHVEELLKSGKKLIVVEPSVEVFRTALETRDFSELLEKIDIRLAEEPVYLAALLAEENASLFIHRGSERLWLEYFKLFSETFLSARRLVPLRILVIGPVYGGSLTTAGYVAATLERMGNRVEFVDCSVYADSYMKIKGITKNSSNEGIIRSKYTDFLGEMIIARAVDFEPDLILALAQAPLSPDLIKRLKQSDAPIAFWFVEDFRSLPYWKEVAPCYDYFFSIQRGEFFNLLRHTGVRNYYYLPQACYPPVHNKLELSSEERERYGSAVSSVGAGYFNRQLFFRGLTDFPFKIWGSEWPPHSPLAPFIREGGRRLDPEEYVKVFNATTVNVNLHSSTFHTGVNPIGDFVNPRTFELASCGAFQLVDSRSELDELFAVGSELVCYENLSDLREKITYYLEHPEERDRIAAAGKARALKDHTFEARLRLLLRIIMGRDHARIEAGIEQRARNAQSGVNNVGRMIREAGEETDVGRFLSSFGSQDRLTPEMVMKKIEAGTGSITDVEAIFMAINEIVTNQE